jgi:hypothetical protein
VKKPASLANAALIACLILATAPTAHPQQSIPRYRGFNLLEKFGKEWSNGPFREEDFAMIADLGFNFVRLPMDYRVWIRDGNWTVFEESVLKEIDQAVEWGLKYKIHVCISFHRAPGYTVASPPERTSLWTDAETQRVCALHWAMFARRYRGVTSSALSFNLFNEPGGVDETVYARIVNLLVKAIRTEDPERLIFADGLDYGRLPCPTLAGLGISQAHHCYDPFQLTHFKAPWVEGSGAWPIPEWPSPLVNTYLYGDSKSEFSSPLIIEGPISARSTVRVRVGTVSTRSLLRAAADGKTVWEHDFLPGPGKGEWASSKYMQEWGTYQNFYGRDYTFALPAGASRLELKNLKGDWTTLIEIGITPPGGDERVLRMTDSAWGIRQTPVRFNPSESSPFSAEVELDRG